MPPDLPTIVAEEYPTPAPFLREPTGEPLPQEIWERMSGLEVMRGQIAGELPLPPVSRLTGLRPWTWAMARPS